MAFVRWKKNAAGNQQAYLMHSYRGEDGKPHHKMLAYLGDQVSLTPERLAELRQKYPDLSVNWEKIKPTEKPMTDVSTLSDADLLRKARHLRHERGFSQQRIVWRLEDAGLPRSGPYKVGLSGREWGILEKALERGEPQDYYFNPEAEVAPALRKVFQSKP